MCLLKHYIILPPFACILNDIYCKSIYSNTCKSLIIEFFFREFVKKINFRPTGSILKKL